MRHQTSALFGFILAVTSACSKDTPKGQTARTAESADQCFRSPHSVLLGQPTPKGQQGAGPGWLRLSGAVQADSGAADLLDADGKRLPGRWSKGGSSLRVVAFDDFLRVELVLSATGGGLAGEGKAHSDATLEPDVSGIGRELHREWPFAGARVSCDSFPAAGAR
jgi:hypothetical protein